MKPPEMSQEFYDKLVDAMSRAVQDFKARAEEQGILCYRHYDETNAQCWETDDWAPIFKQHTYRPDCWCNKVEES